MKYERSLLNQPYFRPGMACGLVDSRLRADAPGSGVLLSICSTGEFDAAIAFILGDTAGMLRLNSYVESFHDLSDEVNRSGDDEDGIWPSQAASPL